MTDKDYEHWLKTHSGWILIVFFCLIPVIIYLNIHSLPTFFDSWYSFFGNLGKLAGIIGFVLYAINLLLSVRKPWLEDFFGGLNRVYIAHHITGGIALAFLVFHPLFLAIRHIQAASVEYAARQLLFLPLDFNASFPEVQEVITFNAGIIAFWAW